MTKRAKRQATKPAVGWGMRVQTHIPYLAPVFSTSVQGILKEPMYGGDRPVRVVLVPLAVARKAGLLKKEKA